MPGALHLEHVKAIAQQLSPQDRLRLVAHICEQLSASLSLQPTEPEDTEEARQKRLAEADALIAHLDKVAALWHGEFDAVKDLREIRGEEP
jgi:hypothetical protein